MAIFHQLSTREFSFDYSDIVNLQFGNPDKISVECSVKPDAEQAANLWLGLVWLCVDGNIVGNVDDRFQEQVGIALGTHWQVRLETLGNETIRYCRAFLHEKL